MAGSRGRRVPSIFNGRCCAGDLTVAELRQVGFQCAHLTPPGSTYYIPEKVFHTVYNGPGTTHSIASDLYLAKWDTQRGAIMARAGGKGNPYLMARAGGKGRGTRS